MVTTENNDLDRWNSAMEKLGPETVQQRLLSAGINLGG